MKCASIMISTRGKNGSRVYLNVDSSISSITTISWFYCKAID